VLYSNIIHTILHCIAIFCVILCYITNKTVLFVQLCLRVLSLEYYEQTWRSLPSGPGTQRPHSSGRRKRQLVRVWAWVRAWLGLRLAGTWARAPGPRRQVCQLLYGLEILPWAAASGRERSVVFWPRRCLTMRQPPPGSAQRPWPATCQWIAGAALHLDVQRVYIVYNQF